MSWLGAAADSDVRDLKARIDQLEDRLLQVASYHQKLVEFVRKMYNEDVAPVEFWLAEQGVSIFELRRKLKVQRGEE